MHSIKRFVIFIFISQTLSHDRGTLSNQYGRISNIDNEHIYVSASLTIADCIRQCSDFPRNHLEYVFEDCFAYNYDLKKYTCELIHSIEPLEYEISYHTKWMTGFKYKN